jgi:GntR family transcriptional regulator
MHGEFMLIDPKSSIPIFRQIADQLRQSIFDGVFKAGEILPSLRQFAVDIKVNPNTIQRAYETLEREGIVETRRGVGVFVANSSIAKLNASQKKLKSALDGVIAQAVKDGLTPDKIRHTFEFAMREYLAEVV